MTEARSVERLLTLGERVLTDSTHIFEGHDLEWEAEELMALTLDTEPEDLALELKLTRRQRERYLSLVARRAAGEPLPFLTGRIEFYGLDLEVTPGAFVPRPSSELTVARALRKLRRRPAPKIVDVCTGAGPIALALAAKLAGSQVWGADISVEGLRQARRNAKRLGIDNASFIISDMYDSLPSRLKGSVDLIAGHVPYVPIEEIDDLPAEVIEHEPLSTLSDETDDGLVLMRRAVEEAPRWLKPGGWLLLEVSDDLTGVMRRMCRKVGLEDKGAHTDEDRLSMVVEARQR